MISKRVLPFVAAVAFFGFLNTTTLNAVPVKQPSKPFLIQGKLPHLTMLVKMMWDDADVALSAEQKKKLLVVRKETLSQAKALNQKIVPLENEIVEKSLQGVNPKQLEEKVKLLAQLRAQATIVHLRCIYNTKNILTQDQLDIIE